MAQFEINVPVALIKRKEYWIAYCPILKTYGYSKTNKEAAFKDFDDAIKTFFYVQGKLGTLNQTLIGLGWEFEGEKAIAPAKGFNSDLPPYRTSRTVNRPIHVPAAAC